MASIVNDRDLALQATDPRLVATSVVITSDAGALFSKPSGGGPVAPASIILSAITSPNTFSSPTITWYYKADTGTDWAPFTVLGSSTGSPKELTSEKFEEHKGPLGTLVKYKCIATKQYHTPAESPEFVVSWEDNSGSSSRGEDAYTLRLDNEARFILHNADGTPVNGQLPLIGKAYVTKGSEDVTLDNELVTYSINSQAGTVGAIINSNTGDISVVSITGKINWIEIKATINLPEPPNFSLYKKLYIYKLVEADNTFGVRLSQNHYFFQYADTVSLDNTAGWSSIEFKANVTGYSDAIVTWSARTYNSSGVEIPGTENIFTANRNVCTVTDANFIARGGAAVARMKVTASYGRDGVVMSKSGYIIRKDGTNSTKILESSVDSLKFEASSETGTVSSTVAQAQPIVLTVVDVASDKPVDDTVGWSFAIIPSTGVTININGGSSPYTAIIGTPVTVKVTSIAAGTPTATLNITATKSGEVTLNKIINITVKQVAPCGETLVVIPDKTIILLCNESGSILSYDDAWRTIKVMRGSTDVTANWNLTKIDGPGVTSTLVGQKLSVTKFSDEVSFGSVEFEFVGSGIAGGDVGNDNELWSNYHYVNFLDGTIVACLGLYKDNDEWFNEAAKLLVSKDWGVTWTTVDPPIIPPVTLADHGGGHTTTYGELAYIESYDMYIYAGTRKEQNSGNTSVYAVYSYGGLTWDITSSITSDECFETMEVDPISGRCYLKLIGGWDYYYSDDPISAANWKYGEISYTLTYQHNSTSVSQGSYAGVRDGIGSYDSYATIFTTANSGPPYIMSINNSTGSWKVDLPGDVLPLGTGEVWPRRLYRVGNLALLFNYNDNSTIYYKYMDAVNDAWKKKVPEGISAGSEVLDADILYLIGDTLYIGLRKYTSPTKSSFYSLHLPSLKGGKVEVLGDADIVANGGYLSSTVVGDPIGAMVGHRGIDTIGENTMYLLYWLESEKKVSCYKGTVTPGHNGYESYITVKATPKASNSYGELETKVIVRRGVPVKPPVFDDPNTTDTKTTPTGDVYALTVVPGEILLPSSSDGAVNPSAYDGVTNVTRFIITKNGEPFTEEVTGGLDFPTAGVTGSITSYLGSEGQITISNVTNEAPITSTVTGIANIPNGPSLLIFLRVTKQLGDQPVGYVPGAVVSGFTTDQTSISMRWNPNGSIEIKRGAGSYVWAANWYSSVDNTNPPGSNYWVKMTIQTTTTTGGSPDTLTGSPLETWLNLGTAREWTLSSTETGTHTLYVYPHGADNAAGNNPMIGSGILEVRVP